MAASPEGIETILDPFITAITQREHLGERSMRRRQSLADQGVIFPSVDAEWLMLLQAAKAATDRGDTLYSHDGSIIDPAGFNYGDGSEVLAAEKSAIDNERKLKIFVKLERIALSSALGIRYTEHRGELNEEELDAFRYIQQVYKQGVQLMLRIEEWEQPWLDVVDDTFEGEGLTFPLSSNGLEIAHNQLFSPLMKDIRHYGSVGLYSFNIYNRIERSIQGQAPDKSERHAGAIGYAGIASLHYNHSPEASLEFLSRYVPDTTEINWQAEVIKAHEESRDILA